MQPEVNSTDAEVLSAGLVQNKDRISEEQNKKQLPKYLKADFILPFTKKNLHKSARTN